MTTVTYRWLASYTVHDFEDIAVRVVTGWDRDEPLDEYDRYEVVRNRRIVVDGGRAFVDDRLAAFDTEGEAEAFARRFCINKRSAIEGAFCFLSDYEEGCDEPLPYLDPHPSFSHLPTMRAPELGLDAEAAYWQRQAIGGEWDDDFPTI